MSQTKDISLKSIYGALRHPQAQKSAQTRQLLTTASTQTIDQVLRKILGYAKREQTDWPTNRLAHMVAFVFSMGFKHAVISLASFKACLRWLVDLLHSSQDKATLRYGLKCICIVFEAIQTTTGANLLADFVDRKGIQILLILAQHEEQSIQFYSLRALNAQATYFSKPLNESLDGYTVCTQLLSDMPTALNTLWIVPPPSDIAQREAELKQSMLTCQLLRSMLKHPNTEYQVGFAESNGFRSLARVWCCLCHYEYTLATHQEPPQHATSQQKLVYVLTCVIQHCTSISKKAAGCVSEEHVRAKWQPLLSVYMQRWIYDTCCTMNTPMYTLESLAVDKTIMNKMIQISLDIVPVLQHHMYWLDYVDQAVCDLTNFMLAYISQPILPEHVTTMGKPNTVLHNNLCIDVDERGYQFHADMLQQHQSVFVLILESFIQHVQLASLSLVQLVCGRAAWCLKSLATVLSNADQLDTSPLRSRILKLIVFFLHYDDAIDTLATSTTSITPFIWGTTIEMAKQGLMTTCIDTSESSSVIYKAKRAFVSLEKISHHHRACERLVDCDVLQLVDLDLIPSGQVIDQYPSLLSMYAVYCRFLAVLSRRTAFVRTKLRDQYHLFPITLKLLHEAVALREHHRVNDVFKAWNQLISSCLMLISAFQYDELSMQQWLCWKQESSVLTPLLAILFPWKEAVDWAAMHRYVASDLDVMLKAAQLLDQLSCHSLCGRQFVNDTAALPNLSRLMICLTTTDPSMQWIITQASQETPQFQCADYLKKSMMRMLMSHENMQFNILRDAFTNAFQPMLYHPNAGTSQAYWRHLMCDALYKHRFSDFNRLYRFTQDGDNAIKLHDFTAVAVAYTAMGAPTQEAWNDVLGFNHLDQECIAASKHVFGALCQMLVYELEYEEEDDDDHGQDTLLSQITPLRRHAAAQVMEAMSLEFEVIWQARPVPTQDPDTPLPSLEPVETVTFVTDDNRHLQAHRQLLRTCSPIFEALLSGDYAESASDSLIPLHDVSFHSLELLMKAMHGSPIDGLSWQDMVELLKMSDRFGATVVKHACEHWVLQKIKQLGKDKAERKVCLEGMVGLYRQCRDPIEKDAGIASDTWPFAVVLRECLKTILMYMSESSQTIAFLEMRVY
ncbi:uncharacterized protein B0P05DRAFT_587461 [Gilbertella persicaria]|uniref:uncharacterized protein n=1 Tax=Gilbertella persicaria TaxID=101096 RepID=UPI00221FF47E|nr:uncharacterized protein B0P05DRAFT_587461 [Gilbertella persicaria]KAI8078233.1 hypothetical protein B0P05DRAFT_587461 [Gilbertella persicaria]